MGKGGGDTVLALLGKSAERAKVKNTALLVSKGKPQKTWLRSENWFVLGIEGLCFPEASRLSVCVCPLAWF